MDLGLSGKRVLITGASKGIGRAIAEVLAEEGCSLHLASRTEADLARARDEINEKHGVQVTIHPLDLSDGENAKRLAQETEGIDILVNNAGAIPGGDIEDSRVLKGVMFNKDVVHGKMRRRIEKPRILLLDCTLEYKKGESQVTVGPLPRLPTTPRSLRPFPQRRRPAGFCRRTSSSRTTRRGRSCSARRRTTSRRSATRSSLCPTPSRSR